MSTFNATVLELACQNEDHDVTTRKSRLPSRHHLQSKRLQVKPIAVVFNNKNYLYESSKSGEYIDCEKIIQMLHVIICDHMLSHVNRHTPQKHTYTHTLRHRHAHANTHTHTRARTLARTHNTWWRFCRLVTAAEKGSYRWLDDMYTEKNISTFNYTKWGVGNQSMHDVYLQHAHRKEDMIAS